MTTTTAIRQRNVVPFADLSSMSPVRITGLLTTALRREAQADEDRYLCKDFDSDRSAIAAARADWWREVGYAAMFTIEDRLS